MYLSQTSAPGQTVNTEVELDRDTHSSLPRALYQVSKHQHGCCLRSTEEERILRDGLLRMGELVLQITRRYPPTPHPQLASG